MKVELTKEQIQFLLDVLDRIPVTGRKSMEELVALGIQLEKADPSLKDEGDEV